MKKKTRKCYLCKIDDTLMENMEVEYFGKNNTPRFYHKEPCFQQHLKDKIFKEQERKELDSLIETIKTIYGVKVVPNSIYPFLQELRNGTKFFGRYDYKYKEGYSYALIKETYDYCSETIEYWNGVKGFSGFFGAFRYGLAIVCDKLSIVEQRQKQQENGKILMQKHLENMEEEEQFKTSYQKPSKSKADISDFLDD